jgi:hypothetical protein
MRLRFLSPEQHALEFAICNALLLFLARSWFIEAYRFIGIDSHFRYSNGHLISALYHFHHVALARLSPCCC